MDYKNKLYLIYLHFEKDVPNLQAICEDAVKRIVNDKKRHYHTIEHVFDVFENALMFNGIGVDNGYNFHYDKTKSDLKESFILESFLFALFHDAFYVPGYSNNEVNSSKDFKDRMSLYDTEGISPEIIKSVARNIEKTASFDKNEQNNVFLRADRLIVKEINSSFEIAHKYIVDTYKEFVSTVNFQDFKQGNFKVLSQIAEIYNYKMDRYYDYLMSKNLNVGVYTGSFNPFHVGHLSIVEEAEKIFDIVIIAKGKNPDKGDFDSYFSYSNSSPCTINGRRVITFSGTIFELHKVLKEEFGKVTFIKGIRNETDLNYEMNSYRILRDIDPTLNTIFLPCKAEYQHISSSMIRNLQKLNLDVSKYKIF